MSNRHGKEQEQAKNEDDSGTHRHLPHVHSPPAAPENVHVLFPQEKTEKIGQNRLSSAQKSRENPRKRLRIAQARSTKVSTTFFCPALSKSTVSLLPSTCATRP